MSQENVEVVRAIYDSVAARGIEGSLDLIDPDFELQGVGQGPITGTYRGHEGARAFSRRCTRCGTRMRPNTSFENFTTQAIK
jgi:ketosteroid isomerase-like protein